MRTQKIQVGIDKKYHSDENIVININEIPFATALYMQATGEVILNKRAYDILGMNENEVFVFFIWKQINPYISDVIKKIE